MGIFKKGAHRKLWSDMKKVVLGNKVMTPAQKAWMAKTFNVDLGPWLDKYEDLLPNGKSDKLNTAYKNVSGALKHYIEAVEHASKESVIEQDRESMLEILMIIQKDTNSSYKNAK